MNFIYFYRRIVLAALFILILGFYILQVAVINRVLVLGGELDFINQQVKHVRAENIILSEKILELESFQSILERAKAAGFIEGKIWKAY